jgi:hypothetical protein
MFYVRSLSLTLLLWQSQDKAACSSCTSNTRENTASLDTVGIQANTLLHRAFLRPAADRSEERLEAITELQRRHWKELAFNGG